MPARRREAGFDRVFYRRRHARVARKSGNVADFCRRWGRRFRYMTIAREEIFGPVLSILPYRDEDEAVRIANDTVYGLSGYVQSGSYDHALRVASRLRTGNVHINGAGPDFAAPFGGYKQSGNGREWGEHGFEEFLETKAVLG